MTKQGGKPTYEQLEQLVSALSAQLIGQMLGDEHEPPRRTRSKKHMRIIGELLDASDDDTGADDNSSYRNESQNGEVVTLDIAPDIELPIEIIGTHEAHATLNPNNRRVDQGGALVWEVQGKEIEDGYYMVVDDGSIFACIVGLHLRISINGLFQAITTPNMRAKLDAARAQFNGLNGAEGKSFYYDSTH